jgi:hypothetical protein
MAEDESGQAHLVDMVTLRLQHAVVGVLALGALAVFCEQSSAQSRGTLMQWSYGTSFEGGPDLNEPLVTDRPDFTEASVTVGQGVAQLEGGYTFFYDEEDGERTRTHSFPETLLRVGMFADWFEFRMDWNYLVEEIEAGGDTKTLDGAEDLTLGLKLALTPQECLLPETAIILQMTVPTGADVFSQDDVMPGFNYLYGWDITEDWSTGASTGLNATTDDETGDEHMLFTQSWTVNYSWNERLTSYTEWFVLAPSGADTTKPENYFNGGFTYLITDDIQWDIRAGVGLDEAADDFFAGTGLSIRYY